MISARDELGHLFECLTEAECEKALELLGPLVTPVKCDLCDRTATSVPQAVAEDWIPSYWHGDEEWSVPVCAACVSAGKVVQNADGEWEFVAAADTPVTVQLIGPVL